MLFRLPVPPTPSLTAPTHPLWGQDAQAQAAGIFSQTSCNPVFLGKNSWGGGHSTNFAPFCPRPLDLGASWSWSHSFPLFDSGSIPSPRPQWPVRNVLVWYILEPWSSWGKAFHFIDKETETLAEVTHQEVGGQSRLLLTHTPPSSPWPGPSPGLTPLPPLTHRRQENPSGSFRTSAGGRMGSTGLEMCIRLLALSFVSCGVWGRSLSTLNCNFYFCKVKELDKTSSNDFLNQ